MRMTCIVHARRGLHVLLQVRLLLAEMTNAIRGGPHHQMFKVRRLVESRLIDSWAYIARDTLRQLGISRAIRLYNVTATRCIGSLTIQAHYALQDPKPSRCKTPSVVVQLGPRHGVL